MFYKRHAPTALKFEIDTLSEILKTKLTCYRAFARIDMPC